MSDLDFNANAARGRQQRLLAEMQTLRLDLVVVQTIIHDLSNEHRSSFIARLKRYAKGHNVASLMAAGQHYDALHLMVRALFQTRGDTSGDALTEGQQISHRRTIFAQWAARACQARG